MVLGGRTGAGDYVGNGHEAPGAVGSEIRIGSPGARTLARSTDKLTLPFALFGLARSSSHV